jgi:hypothetical protein
VSSGFLLVWRFVPLNICMIARNHELVNRFVQRVLKLVWATI